MRSEVRRSQSTLNPSENAQAAVVDGRDIISVNSLIKAVGFLSGALPIELVRPKLDEIFASYSIISSAQALTDNEGYVRLD